MYPMSLSSVLIAGSKVPNFAVQCYYALSHLPPHSLHYVILPYWCTNGNITNAISSLPTHSTATTTITTRPVRIGLQSVLGNYVHWEVLDILMPYYKVSKPGELLKEPYKYIHVFAHQKFSFFPPNRAHQNQMMVVQRVTRRILLQNLALNLLHRKQLQRKVNNKMYFEN